MTAARLRRVMIGGVLLFACCAPSIQGASPLPSCRPALRAMLPLPGRADSLVGLDTQGSAVGLAGAAASPAPFLPHDTIVLLPPHRRGTMRRVALPPYTAPPGLALDPVSRRAVYVLVDTALWRLDPVRGRITARYPLDVQALGWPAALATGTDGSIYVVGQPADARPAVVEALIPSPDGRLHVAWRAQLGLTHAGLWLGVAGPRSLAAYLPDAADLHGSIALFDRRSGALQSAYPAPAPPLALDAARHVLYLDDAGTIRVLALDGGTAVAAAGGAAPLAVASERSLVAFAGDDGIILAASGSLRRLAHIHVPHVTTLAFSPGGATLLAGGTTGVTAIDVGTCHGF